jgi:hypothetical protein
MFNPGDRVRFIATGRTARVQSVGNDPPPPVIVGHEPPPPGSGVWITLDPDHDTGAGATMLVGPGQIELLDSN